MIREAAVAGSFYPESPADCAQAADDCFELAGKPLTIDARIVGGVVPHAGWSCSGMVSATVFGNIAAQRKPETIVFFGAVHRPTRTPAALFPGGCWRSPLGSMAIDGRLAERVLSHTNLIADDPYAHDDEHSIEVQVPLLQRLWPQAKLLPIMVLPSSQAVEIGGIVGQTLASYHYDAVVLASSDLTHYGRRYGFTPKGHGATGLEWAKNVNDRAIIDRMLQMDANEIVAEALEHRNACGGGAIAAAMSAARMLGADRAQLLRHVTSRETLRSVDDDHAVGYAGIVFTASPSS